MPSTCRPNFATVSAIGSHIYVEFLGGHSRKSALHQMPYHSGEWKSGVEGVRRFFESLFHLILQTAPKNLTTSARNSLKASAIGCLRSPVLPQKARVGIWVMPGGSYWGKGLEGITFLVCNVHGPWVSNETHGYDIRND